jgi:DNA-directed RNA polymerase specialized sigma24 family protein
MLRRNSRLDLLLEALERLPEELQEILLLTLEAIRFDPRSAPVNYVTRILGIGRTTYYLRLQQALAELKRQLEQNDGL